MAVGDTNLFFNRDTRVFLAQGATIWEIPVLNGYSFNQSTNSSTVTLAEMTNISGDSRRGQAVFNDSMAPAEWSFDIYARPTLVTGTPNKIFAADEALWANFIAANTYTSGTTSWATGVTRGATALDFAFSGSNKVTLGTFDLYFVLGASKVTGMNYTATESTTIYKVEGCVANEVTLNFEIDGISTLSWSGMGKKISEVASYDASAAVRTGLDATNNMIRNRLTALELTTAMGAPFVSSYDVTLTGGSITISNNITFLTPETLGVVNTPLAHVTGTRSVTGSFTAYLDEKTNSTIDLVEDLLGATGIITNKFGMQFYVGGRASAGVPTAPGMYFNMTNCHLEIPNFNIDDVIGIEVNFTALPTTIGGTDEITKISYVGV